MFHMKCRIHKRVNALQTRTALHHFGPLLPRSPNKKGATRPPLPE
jgi:hypothetical protein